MQHSFFSAASSLKPGVLHLCVVFHLNESVPAKVQGYLSMALRIACLLATCLLTRLALPIATLLAAQFHFTDTQNLDSLTTSYNFPRLKSGVKKKRFAFGPKSYTTCNAVRPRLKEFQKNYYSKLAVFCSCNWWRRVSSSSGGCATSCIGQGMPSTPSPHTEWRSSKQRSW